MAAALRGQRLLAALPSIRELSAFIEKTSCGSGNTQGDNLPGRLPVAPLLVGKTTCVP